jgi:RHS repeat-associated protein
LEELKVSEKLKVSGTFSEYNGSGTLQRTFVWGNYIDEALRLRAGESDFYYLHDHLYSPAVLIGYESGQWRPVERYEYDAYGTARVINRGPDNAWFTPDDVVTGSSAINTTLFTGRTLDALDSGALKIMYYRHRYTDPFTGRFLQQDLMEYVDGMSLYQYVKSKPLKNRDPLGLDDDDIEKLVKCIQGCQTIKGGWGIPRAVCVLRCRKGFDADMTIPDFKSTVEQAIRQLIPTEPGYKYKFQDWELFSVPTPEGDITITIEGSGCAKLCGNRGVRGGILGEVEVSPSIKVCIGPSAKIRIRTPLKTKSKFEMSTGKCPECKDETKGSLSLQLEGKAGAILSASIKGAIQVYPISNGPLSGKLTIGIGDYFGAQICGQLQGSLKKSIVIAKE